MSNYNNSGSPGDTKKFKVKITNDKDTFDVSDAVLLVELYFDIFTGTWTGRVEFNDTTNLITYLPIKSGNSISVEVETDYGGCFGDGAKVHNMVIYKISDLDSSNHIQQQYTAFIASKEFFNEQSKRVNQAFSNKSAHVIVGQIVSELGGELDKVEPSEIPISAVIPGWTPFTAISWLSKSATNAGAADYVFFQVDEGKFAFVPFEMLYSDDKYKLSSKDGQPVIFKKRPAAVRENGDIDDDVTLLIQEEAATLMDTAAQGAVGMYASKTCMYDPISNKWEEHTFKFGDDCEKDKEGKNFEDLYSPEVNVSFSLKHTGMFDKGQSPGETAKDWMGSRKSAIQKMDSERRFIRLAGSASAWEWIGKSVEVDLPSQQDTEENEKLDKARKGRYVIVAIKQHISKAGMSTVIELVKKRLEKED